MFFPRGKKLELVATKYQFAKFVNMDVDHIIISIGTCSYCWAQNSNKLPNYGYQRQRERGSQNAQAKANK